MKTTTRKSRKHRPLLSLLGATAVCVGVLIVAAAYAQGGRGQTQTNQQVPEARGRGQGRGGAGRGITARPRKVVLAWADTRNGIAQHDSVSHALAVIERLGYESHAYDTFIRTDSNIISIHPLMTNAQPATDSPTEPTVDAIGFLRQRGLQLTA